MKILVRLGRLVESPYTEHIFVLLGLFILYSMSKLPKHRSSDQTLPFALGIDDF